MGRKSYQPKNGTSYLHVLVYQYQYAVIRYSNLLRFSGQSLEKTNDIIKQIHHTKSSKMDSTKDALIVQKRLGKGYIENYVLTKR